MYSILIVYASRYGSTAEIAQEIAETLESNEMIAEMIDLRDGMKISTLDEYHGILVGSGIRMGRWTKEAFNFLKNNKEILKTKPLGIFITSGEAANPNTYEKAKKKYLDKFLLDIGIKNNRVMKEAFGGVFDLSSSSNYNYLEKKILKRIAKSDGTGFIVHDGKLNDFRNWQRIRNWATDFSNLVKLKS
ncbi:MAG: flavodoxin domain-containing protein [Candidatus Hodarchaeota archaeon]